MKRLVSLFILTVGLLVVGGSDACGIRLGRMRPFKRPARNLRVRVKRPNPRLLAQAKQNLNVPAKATKAYTTSAQERAAIDKFTLRLQRTVMQSRPLPRIERYRVRSFPARQEIDAAIFDLDGTLLDSLWAWENSGSNYVRSRGFEPPADLDARLETMSLMDGARLVKEMYNLPESPEVLLEQTLEPIKNRYFYEIQPMPGVREQLARLKAQGVKMAVATASHKEFAQRALTRLGMLDYFEFIITCDEVGIGKTSPKVYEVALERLGTAKERTLVAEDALHALETAHKAGFPTAAIEEAHSVNQVRQKLDVADYYILDYEGENTLVK